MSVGPSLNDWLVCSEDVVLAESMSRDFASRAAFIDRSIILVSILGAVIDGGVWVVSPCNIFARILHGADVSRES